MSRYGATSHTQFTGTEACAVKPEDIPAAVQSLRKAFDSDKTLSREWRLGQLQAFATMLREGEAELQAAMLADLHKSPFESIATEIAQVASECVEAMKHLDEWMSPHYTKTAGVNWPAGSYTIQDPLGVVLVMGAWNYPVQLTLSPVVGALAGGNCVMVRPGSYSVNTSHAMCRLLHKYLDNECIMVCEGDRQLTTAILHEKWDKIFFTGSEFVGKLVAEAAAKHLTPCVLELGGKSPTIIDRSAHLTHAAERICWSTFLNSGQTCVRPDFCMVHEEVADKFFEILKSTVTNFYSADPKSTEFFGRLINNKAFERLADLVEKGKGNIKFGGAVDAADRYIEPTVFDFGTDMKAFAEHPLMQDELFGPLLPVVRYSNLEDVITFVRRLPTGKPLALYCYSRDNSVIKAISERTTSGGLNINDCVMHLANHELPFGGVGESGMGSYHGEYSFKAMTHQKAVLRKYPGIDESFLLKGLLAARFPPYTSFKKGAIALFTTREVSMLVNPPPLNIFNFLVKCLGMTALLRLGGYSVDIRKIPRSRL